jgi:hypothetical protein
MEMSMVQRTNKKDTGRSKKRAPAAQGDNSIEFGSRGGADNESLTENRANGPKSDSGIGILPISVLT